MEQGAVGANETLDAPVRKPWFAPSLTVSSVEDITLADDYSQADGDPSMNGS